MTSNGWKKVNLEEVSYYGNEKVPSTEVSLDNYISTENMLPNKSGVDIASKLPTTKNVSRYKEGDILLSNIRPYFKKIWLASKNGGCSNDVLVIKNKDNNILDKTYLYYTLLQDNFFDYVTATSKGTKMPRGDKTAIMNYGILLPPLIEQKVIANHLSTLDEKIETNNQINERLEEMVQALFKHWFVDFEFPNENGEPYKSSGGEMVESELGMIPKGWKIEKIGDISDIQNGYAFKAPEYVEKGIRVLRTLNINEKGYFVNENIVYLPKEYNNDKFKNYFFDKYDLALVMVGASIGKTGIILENTKGALQNQNMWRFRTKRKEIPQLFLINVVRQAQKISQNWSTGSAREFYRKDSFSKIKVLIPEDNLLKQYDSLVFSMFERISNNTQENDRLVLIRDTLLPKLMSGVVRVPLEDGVLEEQGLK